MVRLKGGDIRWCFDQLDEFQFHNGSIKSIFNASGGKYGIKFQFHNGSIKSRSIRGCMQNLGQVSIPQWFD